MSDFIGISMPAHLDNPMAPVPPGTQMYPLHPGQRENQPASSQPYAVGNAALGHSQSASYSGPYPPAAQMAQTNPPMRRGQSFGASQNMMAPPPMANHFPGSGSNSPRYAHSPAASSPYSPSAASHHLTAGNKRGSFSMQQSAAPQHQLSPSYSPAPGAPYYSPDLAQQQEVYNLARQSGHQTPYYSPRVPMSPTASSSPASSLRHQSPGAPAVRAPQFKRVKDATDLKPLVKGLASSRRADPAGGFISVRS